MTGLITVLQALPGRYAGSGFLAVQVANPIFLPLSLEAVRTGGPGLLAGYMIQRLADRAITKQNGPNAEL